MDEREQRIQSADPLAREERSLATDAVATFVLTAAGGAGTTVGVTAAQEAIKSMTGKKKAEGGGDGNG